MTTKTMREIREGEVPFDGGTAVQEDPARPVFTGNGPNDYVCVTCGNLLAASMDPQYMSKRVRIRCGRCRTVNVVAVDESVDPRIGRSRPPGAGS
jgi:phage FluMu protein Com